MKEGVKSDSTHDRLVAGIEEALADNVRYVLRFPGARRPRQAIIYRKRHHLEMQMVDAVSPSSARSLAHVRAYETGRLARLVELVGSDADLWRAVSGQDNLPDEHIEYFVSEHLAELTERYFERRPTQTGVSRALTRELATDYRAYLASTENEATVIVPLTGLKGPMKSVSLGGPVVLRQLTIAEKQDLFARHQDDYGMSWWFDRDSFMDWHYCLVGTVRVPRDVRPTVNRVARELDVGLTAVRLMTNGRVGSSIAWLRPSDTTLFDPADRIITFGERIVGSRSTSLRPKDARELASLYGRLRTARPDRSLRLAIGRYNVSIERNWVPDQLIDCWVGLEALYAPDMRTELRYRIALRGARFLGETASDRWRLFETLRDSYDARSAIVHGGNAPKVDLRAMTEKTQLILRQSILAWLDPNRNHAPQALDAAALN